nr:hypothetical protein [Tanacetum cinerariifolium]
MERLELKTSRMGKSPLTNFTRQTLARTCEGNGDDNEHSGGNEDDSEHSEWNEDTDSSDNDSQDSDYIIDEENYVEEHEICAGLLEDSPSIKSARYKCLYLMEVKLEENKEIKLMKQGSTPHNLLCALYLSLKSKKSVRAKVRLTS